MKYIKLFEQLFSDDENFWDPFGEESKETYVDLIPIRRNTILKRGDELYDRGVLYGTVIFSQNIKGTKMIGYMNRNNIFREIPFLALPFNFHYKRKMFEQFEEEEESWWDEESPFDNFLPKLKIGKSGGDYYVMEELENGYWRILGLPYEYHKSEFEFDLKLNPDTNVRLYDNNSYIKNCAIKNLPQEIKDRLNWI